MISWFQLNASYHRIVQLGVQVSSSKCREGQVQVGCGCLDTGQRRHVAKTSPHLKATVCRYCSCGSGVKNECMFYLCAGFIYKSPRLSREGAERMDGICGRSAAPSIFPPAVATLREAVILAAKSRDRPFHTRLTGCAGICDGIYELPTCCLVCRARSQNVHRLREKAGREPAPRHLPSQHTTSEQQQHISHVNYGKPPSKVCLLFALTCRIHFRMKSPTCLVLAPQCKNFFFFFPLLLWLIIN